MAYRVHQKYTTTSKEAHCHPKSVLAYRYYSPNRPQMFGKSCNNGEGTVNWFGEYRRSEIPESVMRRNVESIVFSERPTWFSDKPDRVLGARCAAREALLNQADYKLLNRNPDKERDLEQIVKYKEDHRKNYKDLTGTKPAVELFHYPTEAKDQFSDRNTESTRFGEYPTPHKAALEHTWEMERGPKHYELYRGLSAFNYHEKVPEI